MQPNNMKSRKQLRDKRRLRIRAVIAGTAKRPRAAVFRSNTTLSLQLIDDDKGETIFSMTAKGKNKNEAQDFGKKVAEKAIKKGIKTVVFDRGGYLYHGSIQALADAMREGGINV